NFYPGKKPGQLRNNSGGQLHLVLVEKMSRFMKNQRPYSRVTEQNLQAVSRRRVFSEHCSNILCYVFKKCHFLFLSCRLFCTAAVPQLSDRPLFYGNRLNSYRLNRIVHSASWPVG